MYIYPDNPYNSFKGTPYIQGTDVNMKVIYNNPDAEHGDMPHNNMPPYYSLIYIMKK